eukprot:gene4202-6548_t
MASSLVRPFKCAIAPLVRASSCTTSISSTTSDTQPVRILHVPGEVSWITAEEAQRWLVSRYHEDLLVLCEHPPTYTAGRRINFTQKEIVNLTKIGAAVFQSKRGGLLTFHGPGQLVGYPIVDVRKHGGVRCYVHKLEETLVRVCDHFGVKAGRSPHTGVWVGDAKIAAIGVQVSRGITRHGFALNCNTDLSWFSNIVPCGIADKTVTSLSNELGRNGNNFGFLIVSVDEVLPVVIKMFSKTFSRTPVLAISKELRTGINAVKKCLYILQQPQLSLDSPTGKML